MAGSTDKKRIVVVSPHTDDGELSCGATMARMVEEGHEVHYLVLSRRYKISDPRYTEDQPEKEMYRAMEVLGVSPDHIHVHDIPVRIFLEHRQDILQILWDFNAEHHPDLVLMPNLNDLHQDHNVVAHEAMRAFKRTTLLGYEQPWNTHTFRTECFVRVSAQHVDRKIRALKCYESQAERSYLSEDLLRGWARTRGVQIGTEFAECFEVPRLVI